MTTQMSKVIQHLRSTMLLRDEPDLTDGKLLECFVSRRETAALETLVQRHGPMVWGVCLRILRNHHDAEDAFQATFLVLVRKAASVRPREMVGNWLYGVAQQTALKARSTTAKQRTRERQAANMVDPAVKEQDLSGDWQLILDQELNHLPDKYRVAIVLCDLEGETRKEAARQLSLPEGTLAGRLTRGRAMLAKRLARHGLAVTGGTLAAWLSQTAASASVPAAVLSSTMNVVTLVAAGKTAATGLVSAKVATLTEGVLKAMLISKLKSVVAVVMVLALIVCGATVLSYRTAAAQDKPSDGANPDDTGLLAQGKAKPTNDSDKLKGTWRILQIVTDGKPNEKDNPDDEADAIFTADTMVLVAQPAGKKFLEFTIKLDATKKPKAIDLTMIGGAGKGKVAHGIYELDGDTLKLCFPQDEDRARPTEFTSTDGARHVLFTMRRQKPRMKQEKEKAKEEASLTAWGKEISGLQAGLGYYPNQKRVYRHGETVQLVVRVRNVGKEGVKFQYLKEFFKENLPTVTNADGTKLPGSKVLFTPLEHVPEEVSLAPGKEIDLSSEQYQLMPTSEREKGHSGRFLALWVGTGKVSVQYTRVFGNTSAGRIKVDPDLLDLTTGSLELEVKSDPPDTKGEGNKTTPPKQVGDDKKEPRFVAIASFPSEDRSAEKKVRTLLDAAKITFLSVGSRSQTVNVLDEKAKQARAILEKAVTDGMLSVTILDRLPMPTKLRAVRTDDKLRIEVASNEDVIVPVAPALIRSTDYKLSVYRNKERVSHTGGTYTPPFDLTRAAGKIPQPSESYEVELVVNWFETDAPIQPNWKPQSGGKYKVLATRTLKLSVGAENTK